MSAFVVDATVINKVVAAIYQDRYHNHPMYGRLHRLWGEPSSRDEFEAIGVELLAMNQDAVMQRYPDCDATNLPGPIDPPPYEFRNVDSTPVSRFKAAQCLSYQCAEGDVPERELYKRLEDTIMIMAQTIVECLPEYETAAWG